jgi:hypothetical protein
MEPKLGDVLSGVDPVAYLTLLAPPIVRYAATALFAIAILHTFAASKFRAWAHHYPEGSVAENLLHLLGEVEVVFGLWSGVLLVFLVFLLGGHVGISYLEHLNFTEPAFVFVIMSVAATRPVLVLATKGIGLVARVIPLPGNIPFVFSALTVGALSGSYITEPAAMTVTALLLRDRVFATDITTRTKYILLGTLFVNVSIGGVLTPYAAPPVLMVASTWNWDLGFMLSHFGYKAALAVLVNAILAVVLCSKDLGRPRESLRMGLGDCPWWLVAIHIGALALVVATAHHMVVFAGVFLFFLGVVAVTDEYQDALKIRESLLVAFFLGGLVVLGTLQRWWLEPVLTQLSDIPLYLGTAALTAITDNAALTYLGSQVPNLSEAAKYYLVAGAVAGGGLTVIANAPNPAGYSILQGKFGSEGISALGLLLAALTPTVVAILALGFLP